MLRARQGVEAMESFFGTQREYPDRDAARRDLFAYIESYYDRQRLHSAIGYIARAGRGEIGATRCPLSGGKVNGPSYILALFRQALGKIP